MNERELERKHRDHESATDDHAAPGRANTSAGLQRRAEPQASGILMRKARDANGVEAGAENAVDAAASSSGSSLPTSLQRKFESSLGTDLSSVRVHTGGASEAATNAVGARAYAVGQDIHFGAGSYDPSSQAGQHLIAHEVAHTVQQRGGSPTRQNKLEVSTPFDATEHEADRAADAMVHGAPFAIGGGSSKISRDYRTDLDKAADEGAQQAQGAKPDQVMSVQTIKDKSEASRAHGFISTWTAELNEALDSKDAAPYMLKKNNEALSDLQQYQGASAAQDQGLANFKLLYKDVQVAYARLNGMAATTGMSVTDKNAEKGVSKESGKDLANDHIGNAARNNKGTAALAERAQKLAGGDEQLAAKLKALQVAKEPLQPQVNEVVKAQSESTNAVHRITNASARITGLDSSFKSASLKSEYAAAKTKVDELNKSVEDTLGLLIDVTKTAVDPTTTAAKAAQFVGEKIGPKLAVMAAKAAGIPG
ncbi:MAG: DUF4157 domain-containing protein, partial [Deltaproteobacteria bacterium]|nr:DUF4157 domain-containing protein [Deltaproteobacteria bacterium]